MGTIAVPETVKLIIGALAQTTRILDEARPLLESRFGPTDTESAAFSFTFTTYYKAEMGVALVKQFYSFSRPIEPMALASIKLATNGLERTFVRPDGHPGRGINLDPGYITPAQLVLATTKNYSHRIAIGYGVYAEITLNYQKGAFHPRPWTYPDDQTELTRTYLERVRRVHLEQR